VNEYARTKASAKIAATHGAHYSFGCLASRADRFPKIIREQFVKMHQDHDVLQEILDCAREDLKDPKGLPHEPPKLGALNIKQVLDAEYAFA
jgi:DNA-directed RNA polymerase, mitochondrial